ncbi:MAG: hypothetical protein R6X22_10350 [Gemmatimonadota bacterium]
MKKFFALILFLAVAPLQAQSVRLHVERVGELQSPDGGFIDSMPLGVDPQGRIWVSTGMSIQLFRQDGTFLRSFGREGDGPNEFRLVGPVAFDGDSAFVLDLGRNRVVVFGPDLEEARSINLSFRASWVAVTDRTIFLNGRILDERDLAGYTVHEFTRAGDARIASMDESPYLFQREYLGERVLTGAAGGIWSVKRYHSPDLARYGHAGREQGRFTISAEWAEPYETLTNPTPDTPPRWSIWSAHDDGRYVWIAGGTGDPDYRSALGDPVTVEGGRQAYQIGDHPEDIWDGVISAFDPARGDPLASVQVDEPALLVGPGPVFITYSRDDLGFFHYAVWRVRVERARR